MSSCPFCLWLHVEGYGIRCCYMSAFQVSEFDHLVTEKARVGMGHRQMTLAHGHGKSGVNPGAPSPAALMRMGARSSWPLVSITLPVPMAPLSLHQGGFVSQGFREQKAGAGPRSTTASSDINSPPASPGRNAGSMRASDCASILLAGDPGVAIDTVFATNLLHFFVVCGDPERAALGIFRIRWQAAASWCHSDCE